MKIFHRACSCLWFLRRQHKVWSGCKVDDSKGDAVSRITSYDSEVRNIPSPGNRESDNGKAGAMRRAAECDRGKMKGSHDDNTFLSSYRWIETALRFPLRGSRRAQFTTRRHRRHLLTRADKLTVTDRNKKRNCSFRMVWAPPQCRLHFSGFFNRFSPFFRNSRTIRMYIYALANDISEIRTRL